MDRLWYVFAFHVLDRFDVTLKACIRPEIPESLTDLSRPLGFRVLPCFTMLVGQRHLEPSKRFADFFNVPLQHHDLQLLGICGK
jgi:hypothetical protein